MMNEAEQWRPVAGWKSYRVSSLGRVSRGGRILRPNPLKSGHTTVCLSEGRRATAYVHRLVLEAFVGEAPSGLICRHLNGIPGDNRLSNLAWGTRAQNATDVRMHIIARAKEEARQEGRLRLLQAGFA
jgi:hypothetical protein